MAVLTHADVARALHRTLSTDEQAEATALIADYQAQMEAYLRRSIEPRQFVESGFAYNGRRSVRRGPVVSVASASVDGEPIDSTQWKLYQDEVGVPAADGQTVALTYTGGWDAENARPAVRAVLMRVCRTLNQQGDDVVGAKTVSVEGESVAYQEDAFTEAELRAVSTLKRRTT